MRLRDGLVRQLAAGDVHATRELAIRRDRGDRAEIGQLPTVQEFLS